MQSVGDECMYATRPKCASVGCVYASTCVILLRTYKHKMHDMFVCRSHADPSSLNTESTPSTYTSVMYALPDQYYREEH